MNWGVSEYKCLSNQKGISQVTYQLSWSWIKELPSFWYEVPDNDNDKIVYINTKIQIGLFILRYITKPFST